jgi:two-component sensor histidine kinase
MKPVVEASPTGGSPMERTLRQRVRQQEILAELGVLALQGTPFVQLLDHTARLTAEGLEAEFCKVLEYLPAERRLLVRAGVGWGEGIVGVASVGADLESPAGYALQTGKPVISNHLENEERFRTPELLVRFGIRRAMNVILQGDGSPYGVLEVDSRAEGEFSAHDIAFLQGAANLLGMAIERQRYEAKLKSALDRHQMLLMEISHRVKNSLQLVASMLHLQAKAVGDPVLTSHLGEASNRVSAVARAYDRLAVDADVERIEIGGYLREVCKDFDDAVAHCEIKVEALERAYLATTAAIPLALIVSELVTNAAKYGYPKGTGGPIWVSVTRPDSGELSISVRDEGVGLPADFDPARSKGLGMRIVTALARQLGATLTRQPLARGTEFTLVLPIEADVKS